MAERASRRDTSVRQGYLERMASAWGMAIAAMRVVWQEPKLIVLAALRVVAMFSIIAGGGLGGTVDIMLFSTVLMVPVFLISAMTAASPSAAIPVYVLGTIHVGLVGLLVAAVSALLRPALYVFASTG